jgi:hypothetical protein
MKHLQTFESFLNEGATANMSLQDFIDELGSWPEAASQIKKSEVDLSKIKQKDDQAFWMLVKKWSKGIYDEDILNLVQQVNDIISKIERKIKENEEDENSPASMKFWRMEQWLDGTSSVKMKVNKAQAKQIESLIETELIPEIAKKFPEWESKKSNSNPSPLDIFVSPLEMHFDKKSRKWMEFIVYPKGWMVKDYNGLTQLVKNWFENLAKKMRIEITG